MRNTPTYLEGLTDEIVDTTVYTTEQQFLQQANAAYMQVITGAVDYDNAMKNACNNLARDRVREFIGTVNGKQPRAILPKAKADIQQISSNTIVSINDKPTVSKLTEVETIKTYNYFTNDIKPADALIIQRDLEKVNTNSLKLISKYTQNMRADLYNNTDSYYNPVTNKINLNIIKNDKRSTALGFTANLRTFFYMRWGIGWIIT